MFCKKCRKEIPDNSTFCNFCGKKQVSIKRSSHYRSHGLGSICYKEKRKVYEAYAPSTKNNTSGRVYLGRFKTYYDADKYLSDYLSGRVVEMSTLTISEIYDKWKNKHFQKLTKSGEQNYITAYKYLSSIYTRQISELKAVDYQKCVDECAKSNKRAQCDKVRQLCSQLCKYAMQNDIINKNYASFVELPQEEKKEKEVFTNQEIETLWAHKEDKRIKAILIMLYTGYRIDEFLSIKKKNVHLDERYIIAGNKTEAGKNRYMPINEKIFDFIKYFMETTPGDRLINDNPNNFRKRVFYPGLSDLGIIDPPVDKIVEEKDKSSKTGKRKRTVHVYENPRLTPHCTRHSFATLSVEAGVKPEVLQKLMGHVKYETTADIYYHQNYEGLNDAINLI